MSTVMVNDKGEVVNGRMRVLAAREMNRRLAKKGRSSVKVPVDRKAPRRMTVREAWRRTKRIEALINMAFGWHYLSRFACIIRGDELTETNITRMYQHGKDVSMGRKPL